MTFWLVNLAGCVGLLLWGLHMVRSGVMRAGGAELRSWLRASLGNRLAAFAAGLGVTAALQSSTATALMVGGFTARGYTALPAALAVMLGANVGSSLVVHALAFDTGPASALLIVGGFVAFRRGGPRIHDLGRAAIGLGLMLLALRLLTQSIPAAALGPAEQRVLADLAGEPAIPLLVAAALACAAHSSVAAVLIVAALAGAGVVPGPAALAMVLGANLGSALNPVLAFRADPAGLRLALGNLAARLAGCALLLPWLPAVAVLIGRIDSDPARLPAAFNTALNLGLALLFLPLLPWLARGLTRLVPDRLSATAGAAASRLAAAPAATASLALANAKREALRMVDVLETMLQAAKAALHTDDRSLIADIRRQDALDGLHAGIEAYLSQLDRSAFDPHEARRLSEILAFAVNLEHAGDVIERSLTAVAAKKIKGRLTLAPEVMAEIDALFARLSRDVQLAGAVFLHQDPDDARRLFAAKEEFRDLERRLTLGHFDRLCAGRSDSLQTSAVVLDVARDLKRIESHIAASAQPVLHAHGLLRPSRLAARG